MNIPEKKLKAIMDKLKGINFELQSIIDIGELDETVDIDWESILENENDLLLDIRRQIEVIYENTKE